MKKIFYLPLLILCCLFQVNTEVMGQCPGDYVFNPASPAISVTNGNAISFCESPSITIRLSGGQTGNWTVSGASISTSTNSITLINRTAGLYAASVTIPAAGNCVLGFTINIKDNPTGITFSANPVPIVRTGTQDTIHLCPNTTTTLSAACLSATCPINQNGYFWYQRKYKYTNHR